MNEKCQNEDKYEKITGEVHPDKNGDDVNGHYVSPNLLHLGTIYSLLHELN